VSYFALGCFFLLLCVIAHHAGRVHRRRMALDFTREDLRTQLTAANKLASENEAATAARIGALEAALGTTADGINTRLSRLEQGRTIEKRVA
jgi:hypothetical protein